MEVNKEQAEKCRDLGAEALRRGDYPRAAKMLKKSLQLFPLPGVEALYTHAERKMNKNNNSSNSSTDENTSPNTARTSNNSTSNGSTNTSSTRQSQNSSSSNSNAGADGRAYTDEQAKIVQRVLKAKEGGRGAHYRVLDIPSTATENDIKKAYRKISLKVHPDKNSAPHADEAFKAVGLAYATLSDSQKRTIYDRYGDEDPDNRGGGAAARSGGVHMRHGGREMTPEEIFQAFFGGGMAGGGPGMHFYSTGFGPGGGVRFHAGGMPRNRQQQQQQQQQPPNPLAVLVQFLPIFIIMLFSFFGQSSDFGNSRTMPGENQYFSLTNKHPFTNPLQTRLSKVKEIPYYVSDKFLRTYGRDRYQLSRVENLVEKAYENYLINECQTQHNYKKRLWTIAQKERDNNEKERKLKLAKEFEMIRCEELKELFPDRYKKQRW